MLLMQKKGYGLAVITNQSGIARGYYTRKEANDLHAFMCEALLKEGICIEGVYLCPHGPQDYCGCRKPKPGLFLQAIRELFVDTKRSVVVGDRLRDIEPAKQLGLQYGLVLTGHGREENLSLIEDKYIFSDLLAFARSLKNREEEKDRDGRVDK
jgi:D-glycero-D-manno-heptose 1,7-bisphosphate phosphatase